MPSAIVLMLAGLLAAPSSESADFAVAGARACRCENRVILFAWDAARTTVLVVDAEVDKPNGAWRFTLGDRRSQAEVRLDRYAAKPSIWPYCTDLVMHDAHPSSAAVLHGRLTLTIATVESRRPAAQRVRASAHLTGALFPTHPGTWQVVRELTIIAAGRVDCDG